MMVPEETGNRGGTHPEGRAMPKSARGSARWLVDRPYRCHIRVAWRENQTRFKEIIFCASYRECYWENRIEDDGEVRLNPVRETELAHVAQVAHQEASAMATKCGHNLGKYT